MKRRIVPAAACAVALALVGIPASLAVYNGAQDGNGHPAVGFILGTIGPDPCDYNQQVIGCSGVLIAPDVFLSTANCVDAFESAVATGFIDDAWVTFDPFPIVEGEVEPALDCTQFVAVTDFDVNPIWVSSGGTQGDVGVLILGTAQTIAPAALPPANRLKPRPRKRLPDITAAGYGEVSDPGAPTGFDIFSLLRRFSHASIGTIGPETHVATLDAVPGPDQPCIGFNTRGAPTYETGLNQVVSLANLSGGPDCANPATFQRLDVASVRSFLANYVTLP